MSTAPIKELPAVRSARAQEHVAEAPAQGASADAGAMQMEKLLPVAAVVAGALLLVAAAAGGGVLARKLVANAANKGQYLRAHLHLHADTRTCARTSNVLHTQELVSYLYSRTMYLSAHPLRVVDKKERKAGIDRERDLRDEQFAEHVAGCAVYAQLLTSSISFLHLSYSSVRFVCMS